MTIEAKLDELIEINRGILTALQSGAQIAATAASAVEAEPAKRGRKPKTEAPAVEAETRKSAPVVDGDPEGTRYWVSPDQVYAQKPGDPDPQDLAFKIESADYYLQKKAEYAAKKSASESAVSTQPTATSGPSATAPAADASEPDFKTVTEAIIKMNKTLGATDPLKGRQAVLDVISKFLGTSEGKKVPDLASVGKNAEILAYVESKMAPEASDADLGI